MRISCKVVEDILPLYVDDCCSEDTKQLLEEHLIQCDACQERLAKLKQPMFLSQEQCINEKTYAKHAKRAFGKLRRRLVAFILIILMFMIPLTWLGVNEVKGDGISYSNLAYVLRGNALLRALKNDNYEKAFSYLNLKPLYEWETEFEETDLDLKFKQVTIGGDNFYVDEGTYNNVYQFYMNDDDEASFWRSIYLNNDYMIPVQKAALYLDELEDIEKHDFLVYTVNGHDYYIDGKRFNYDIENVGNSIFNIMPADYYNQIKTQIKDEEKETKEIIQKFLNKGYGGYVDEYKQQWINNFHQLKEDGVTITGYKLTSVNRLEKRYQLDYQHKLSVNGKITYDYGVIFSTKDHGFYPIGGFVSGSSMESDKIPIISAFHHTLTE